MRMQNFGGSALNVHYRDKKLRWKRFTTETRKHGAEIA